uniref:carbonic anhydrase 6-like n=1 Tax=Myxine glutinosa TaxID=7769 RepID=UPI00358FBCFB
MLLMYTHDSHGCVCPIRWCERRWCTVCLIALSEIGCITPFLRLTMYVHIPVRSATLLFTFALLSDAADWCYESSGSACVYDVAHWAEHYQHCGGKSQSPINIDTNSINVNTSLHNFVFEGYDEILSDVHMVNNGHTVQVLLNGKNLSVRGGGLDGEYVADQFHLHWGNETAPGSEHQLNNIQLPMELHIVHHKASYGDIQDALTKPDGLAVLGFWIDVGKRNTNYDEIVNELQEITHKDENTTIPILKMADLLPSNCELQNYYRYHGSLTTPKCQEVVIWTIFETKINLSQEQINRFSTTLMTEGNISLTNIFRPVQPVNSRSVQYSQGQTLLLKGTIALFTCALTCFIMMAF